jgi:predicted N-acetyltransferase YhbS
MEIKIRSEEKEDYNEIRIINELAFNQKNEGKLVDDLRKKSDYNHLLSLVAETKGKIVGHILFYPIKIKNETDEFIVLSLAPMAVHPDFQNKGIGSKLVKRGLEAVKETGYDSVIVVGHPNYYPRFGFSPANKWNIKLPIECPDDVFLAIELEKDSLKNVSGLVEFPKEYYDCM